MKTGNTGTKRIKIFSVCIALPLTVSASGCTEVSRSDSGSAPAYLTAAEPVDGSENLSEIHADFLADEAYSAALRLGENLLTWSEADGTCLLVWDLETAGEDVMSWEQGCK